MGCTAVSCGRDEGSTAIVQVKGDVVIDDEGDADNGDAKDADDVVDDDDDDDDDDDADDNDDDNDGDDEGDAYSTWEVRLSCC